MLSDPFTAGMILLAPARRPFRIGFSYLLTRGGGPCRCGRRRLGRVWDLVQMQAGLGTKRIPLAGPRRRSRHRSGSVVVGSCSSTAICASDLRSGPSLDVWRAFSLSQRDRWCELSASYDYGGSTIFRAGDEPGWLHVLAFAHNQRLARKCRKQTHRARCSSYWTEQAAVYRLRSVRSTISGVDGGTSVVVASCSSRATLILAVDASGTVGVGQVLCRRQAWHRGLFVEVPGDRERGRRQRNPSNIWPMSPTSNKRRHLLLWGARDAMFMQSSIRVSSLDNRRPNRSRVTAIGSIGLGGRGFLTSGCNARVTSPAGSTVRRRFYSNGSRAAGLVGLLFGGA